MLILVTGSSGGIGKTLVKQLVKGKHEVITPRSKEINFSNTDAVLSQLNHKTYDVIIHLAFDKLNHKNTIKMTENALKLQSKLFIYMSSWVVNFKAPIKDRYTKSKEVCEKLVETSKDKYVIIRPSLVIGDDTLMWQRGLFYFANCRDASL